jgi:hypothetical protein
MSGKRSFSEQRLGWLLCQSPGDLGETSGYGNNLLVATQQLGAGEVRAYTAWTLAMAGAGSPMELATPCEGEVL